MAERSAAHVAFGRAVRSFRAERQISQEELAYRSGLHRTYISDVERGERNLTLESILKLAAALEVPPGQLVDPAQALPTRGRSGIA